MVPLGMVAPGFQLPDVKTGKILSLQDLKSEKATLVMFICNHCPFVVHVQSELVRLANDYLAKGVSIIAISSNDAVQYPADSPENMQKTAEQWQLPFPYLYDESQEVARAYDATCTPDFYLFDGNLELVYRGQLDDSRPKNGKPLTGKDLRHALDCILTNQPVPEEQYASIGCNIKWKA